MCSIAPTATTAHILEPAIMMRMEHFCHEPSSHFFDDSNRPTFFGQSTACGGTFLEHFVSMANTSFQLLVHTAVVGLALGSGANIDWPAVYFSFSLAIVFGWAAAVAYGTLVSEKNRWAILSVKKSLSELFDNARGSSRLDILDLFRVGAIVWVVANHLGSEGRVDVLDRMPSARQFKDAVHNHPIFGALLGNSALGVEIFLVLSGLLAARSWNRKADVPFQRHCVSFLVRRWFRLTPIVAAFIFLATGPIMEMALPRFYTTMVSSCGAKGILSHLTLAGNLQSTPTCLGYLWYLGLDMQLYLAAPFLLHFLYKRPKWALALFALLITVSTFLRGVYCQVYGICNQSDIDIPFISYPGQSAELLQQIYAGLWDVYSRPHTKCGPFLIGILLGQLTITLNVEMVQQNLEISTEKATKWFYAGLVVAVATIYAILPEYWWPNQGNTLYNTLYTATFRTVFAAALAIMILALFLNPKRTQLGKCWAVAAKLTFNAYLLHMPVVYMFNFVQSFQEAQSVYGLLMALPFAVSLSFALAFVFYLLVESPFSRISAKMLRHLNI